MAQCRIVNPCITRKYEINEWRSKEERGWMNYEKEKKK